MARQIGLKDLYFATITKDDDTGITYGTPKQIARGINAKVTPKTTSEKQYSDDQVEEIINNFDGVDVELEINTLTLEARALLQGITMENGELLETSDDISPEGALMFRSKKSNGKYRYVVLYKGKFEIAEDEFATIADTAESKTPKLKGSFYARNYDGAWRFTMDEDETGVNTTKLTNWFTTVQEKTGVSI